MTLSESGTYYFWLKAADKSSDSSAQKTSGFSKSATFDFTYSKLSAPTNVAVTKSTEATNYVTVTWATASNAKYYWIYKNTTNDSSSATKVESAIAILYVSSGKGSYDIILEETGTYYFWIKAADGYASSSGTSDFSDSASISFTYTTLTTPTNVTAKASSYTNKVDVSWTASNAQYYWIYYATENDSAKATKAASAIASLYVTNGTGKYSVSLKSSGTYYFWVKAANSSSSSSKTSEFSAVSAAYSFTYQN